MVSTIMQGGQKHDSTDNTECETQISRFLTDPADWLVCQIGDNIITNLYIIYVTHMLLCWTFAHLNKWETSLNIS